MKPKTWQLVLRALCALSFLSQTMVDCFQTRSSGIAIYTAPGSFYARSTILLAEKQASEATTKFSDEEKPDNKAMSFLKKIGRVGGRQDFTHALGVDEGSAGKASMGQGGAPRKSKLAYKSCQETGLIDDCTEPFPLTSMGTSWSGYTDQVMGGQSTGLLARETDFYGRTANVLRGTVRSLPGQPDKFGFVQMATNLITMGNNHEVSQLVDASAFDGMELDVLYEGENPHESFNVHLKTDACQVPQASYRATFSVDCPGTWKTIRIPWSHFKGFGLGASETPFDPRRLVRAGIVAIGEAYPTLGLGISGVRLFKEIS